MFVRLLLFVIFAAVWWVALWFALPFSWLQGTLPSLVAIHAAPPLMAVLVWWGGKRGWAWHKVKTKERADKAEPNMKAAAEEVAKSAHQEALKQRHAHLECRAVWANVVKAPDWFAEGVEQCLLQEQKPETLQKLRTGAALTASLQQVFATAFVQCEASEWLPILLGKH